MSDAAKAQLSHIFFGAGVTVLALLVLFYAGIPLIELLLVLGKEVPRHVLTMLGGFSLAFVLIGLGHYFDPYK